MTSEWKPIVNNKVKAIIYIIEEIKKRKDNKHENERDEEFLNDLLFEVDIQITHCYSYVLKNEMNNVFFDQLKTQFHNLIKLFKEITKEIFEKGFVIDEDILETFRDLDVLVSKDESYSFEKEQRYFELKKIFLDTSEIKDNNIKNSGSYESSLWFQVGVKFANGEIYSLIEKYGNNASKISKEIDLKRGEKYILASINNYSNDNSNKEKNIFNSPQKISKIINYCKEQNISMSSKFLKKIENK